MEGSEGRQLMVARKNRRYRDPQTSQDSCRARLRTVRSKRGAAVLSGRQGRQDETSRARTLRRRLSDEKLALTRALELPTMQVAGLTLIKRLALVIDDARISHVFYPVFPPDRNAGDVLAWLKQNRV